MSENVTIIARKLPGHEPRPHLARLLKTLLRRFRLECIEVREDTAPWIIPAADAHTAEQRGEKR